MLFQSLLTTLMLGWSGLLWADYHQQDAFLPSLLTMSLNLSPQTYDSTSDSLAIRNLLLCKQTVNRRRYTLPAITGLPRLKVADSALAEDLYGLYTLSENYYTNYYLNRIELLNLKDKGYLYLSLREAKTNQGLLQFRIPLDNLSSRPKK